MTATLAQPLTQIGDLIVRAQAAEIVPFRGRQALRLENGLVLVPGLEIADATVEVMLAAEGAAYPGVAFRVADVLNHELAYAPPHSGGRWDAIQYDPVFRGSNTWQAYHGPSYQQRADVPTGEWYRLRVSFCGGRAAVYVDDKPPLVVEQLACPARAGLIGIWSYLPAYFRDLRVSPCDGLDGPAGVQPGMPDHAIEEWFVEGYGAVRAEPNGVVNLNRLLSPAVGEARLARRFELDRETTVCFSLGFSDAISLDLDGETIFSGENTYHSGADPSTQGYIDTTTELVTPELSSGPHVLTAALRVSEGFGWGLAMTAQAEGLRWLPAAFG